MELLENRHLQYIKMSVNTAFVAKHIPGEEREMLLLILDDVILGRDNYSDLRAQFDWVIGGVMRRNKERDIMNQQAVVSVCIIASFCSWVRTGRFMYRTKPCKMTDEGKVVS